MQILVPAVIAFGATIVAAKITSKGAKEASAKVSETQAATTKSIATSQLAAEQVEADKIREEQRIQNEKFAVVQERQLKIEAQRFNIETLAGILQSRKQVSEYPVIYQTPPARVETGMIARINSFLHNILRG